MNVIIRKDKTKMDLARFLHVAAFSSAKTTLIKAIKNNHFTSWSGITTKLICKSLLDSITTTK